MAEETRQVLDGFEQIEYTTSLIRDSCSREGILGILQRRTGGLKARPDGRTSSEWID